MMTKRIVSLLLAVMMIVAVIPAGIISISAEDTTYTDVVFTPDSWLCETDPESEKSKEPMITEDGTNFYYPDPRVPGDPRGAEIGSSDEGIITSVKDYIFADGFKFTFDANVCRAGCAAWGGTLFSISFGTDVNFEVSIKEGYKLTVNGKTYTKNPKVACTNSWQYTPTNEAEANKINGTYTVEYMDGKVTVKFNGDAIDFGQILIDAKNFEAGKIQFEKGWSWTKVAKDSYDPKDYATDFLIFSNVTLSLPGEHIHTYGEYVSNNDATCAKDATKTATCTVEGCGKTNTVIIPDSALGHNFVSDKNGTTKTCSVCGITLAAVEFTPDSWLCEKYPNRPTSTYPMATEDGKNFYYQAPRGDEKSSSNNEIGSSDEGLITSVKDYNFADGFKFTFDANVCRAGCKTWGVTLFTISFGTAVKLEVGIGDGKGYKLTVNGTTYTMNPWPPCFENWAPKDEDAANLINGIYTIEYMDGKVTVELNGKAIDFGQDILIDAEDFAAGKIQFEKGWTWTKVAKDSYDPKDYATDFLIFSKVTFEKVTAPVAPVFEGVQDAKVGNVLSVRFVGTVKDLNYSKVGFKITAMDGDEDKSWTKETNTVYSSLIGNTDTGVKIYDKTNLHGQYIYALTIQGVPTEGTVTFNVTAYGIVDGKEVTDTTFAVTYTNGLFDKIVVIA